MLPIIFYQLSQHLVEGAVGRLDPRRRKRASVRAFAVTGGLKPVGTVYGGLIVPSPGPCQ